MAEIRTKYLILTIDGQAGEDVVLRLGAHGLYVRRLDEKMVVFGQTLRSEETLTSLPRGFNDEKTLSGVGVSAMLTEGEMGLFFELVASMGGNLKPNYMIIGSQP